MDTNKICFHLYVCDDDLGEMDAFFELRQGKLALIAQWSLNDAHYRGEYMRGLFKHFGVDVKILPENLEKSALELLKGVK